MNPQITGFIREGDCGPKKRQIVTLVKIVRHFIGYGHCLARFYICSRFQVLAISDVHLLTPPLINLYPPDRIFARIHYALQALHLHSIAQMAS